jgi:hypothetical protein|tara:strand:+ start:289 stop:522 length:234 start_codon:yes stop_codon:yes gene_type:complete
MQNISIPDIIANLKGRRGYVEKKAKKLGYNCLEKYFEDKLANEAQLLAENGIKEEKLLTEKKAQQAVPAGKKTCGCC